MISSIAQLARLALPATAALLATAATAADSAPGLAAALRRASAPAPLELPGPAELQAAQVLFEDILARRPAAAVAAAADRLALVWEPLADGSAIWILRERDDARRGRGFLAVRVAGGRGSLQVPHSFKDEMTREIGLALFLEGDVELAIWNTVPRRYQAGGQTVDADMAHLEDTYFNALTRALGRARGSEPVLQLHGFDDARRRTAAGAAAGMILSSGDRRPQAALRRLRDCLARTQPAAVGLYPETVQELGGTTNVQGRTLRALGLESFIHLEMDRATRRQLRDQPAARGRLLQCLKDARG